MDYRYKKIEIKREMGFERKTPKNKRLRINFQKFSRFSIIVLILLLVIFIPLFFLIKNVYFSLQKTIVSTRKTYEAGKNQDIDSLKINALVLKEDLEDLEESVNKLTFLKFIPIISGYTRDAEHLTRAAKSSVEALNITIEAILPYADLLGLKGESTFVSGSADERIKTAVETLDKLIPNVDQIAEKVAQAETELDSVDFDKYPESIGKIILKSRLVSAKNLFHETASLFVDARPLLKELPQLFGSKESKRYLVIFQNDAELRATGGFMTAFAIFKIDKGKLQVERSDDIYKLDEAKKRRFPAPAPIVKYHQGVTFYELRDSNLSPDYYVSMQTFEKLLSEAQVNLGDYEGIIALDTHVLVSIVKILGSFSIAGREFSVDIDKRCDCPKVIYELEDYATRPVAFVREDRKGIIGSLLYQIMQRALGVSPSQYWGQISQMLLEETKQKHILFYFHDQGPQKGIETLNYGGRIKDYIGDYIHINNVNFAGAKSNLFVKNYVKQEIKTEPDGTIVKTVILTYKNPSPASNCNLEAGQLCLNGILRNWLRVYVPKGSTLVDFTGSEKETVTYEELNKTVFEGFLTVKPQGTTEVKITYKLPFKTGKDQSNKLLIQKQAGTNNDEYVISYLGKEQKLLLTTDTELTLR